MKLAQAIDIAMENDCEVAYSNFPVNFAIRHKNDLVATVDLSTELQLDTTWENAQLNLPLLMMCVALAATPLEDRGYEEVPAMKEALDKLAQWQTYLADRARGEQA